MIYHVIFKIAGDLLDLVGDSAFEVVQDLIMVCDKKALSSFAYYFGL